VPNHHRLSFAKPAMVRFTQTCPKRHYILYLKDFTELFLYQIERVMMKRTLLLALPCCLMWLASSYAFSTAPRLVRNGRSMAKKTALLLSAMPPSILDRLRSMFSEKPVQTVNLTFDDVLKKIFPGAIDNNDLEQKVVQILADRGFDTNNTLLATSLCCDELARRLEDDFVKIYGNNFNLGGLSGFPFAGNTG
jgi:Limiting CO2-inducible proteins B/C beta carbonyic anhydrases